MVKIIVLTILGILILSTGVLIYYGQSLAIRFPMILQVLFIEFGKIHYTGICIGLPLEGPELLVNKGEGFIREGKYEIRTSNHYCYGVGITVVNLSL